MNIDMAALHAIEVDRGMSVGEALEIIRGNKIDLSGPSATIGVNIRF